MDNGSPSVCGSLNVVALFPADEGVTEYSLDDLNNVYWLIGWCLFFGPIESLGFG